MQQPKRHFIPEQLAASDPTVNVWVNASAGSGKTKVLIDRILRLLLLGSDPQTIVCITFTKAAALEMRQRLSSITERWIFLEEPDLIDQLQGLDPQLNISPGMLALARNLFNTLLDQPVQIQTIHSLAQTILGLAPTESGISVGGRLMDDMVMKQTINRALDMLLEKEGDTETFQQVYRLFSQSKFNDILNKIIDERAFFRFILMDGAAKFDAKLDDYLGRPQSITDIQQSIAHLLKTIDWLPTVLPEAASSGDHDFLKALNQSVQSQSWSNVKGCLLTDKGSVRKRLISKKMAEALPYLLDRLTDFSQSVYAFDQELKKAKTKEATRLVVYIADHFLTIYSHLKHTEGMLDYDDLIFKTLEVLSNPETAPNILFRLDNQINHVLVDEAQDTNLYQWSLIGHIVDAFFQNDTHKTLFVVGDHKQAIYGFQGTDPEIFHKIPGLYKSKSSLRLWQDVNLTISFRSLHTVLNFVDSIFQARQLIEPYTSHTAFRKGEGRVVVHPLCVPDETDPSNLLSRYAIQIADAIASLIQGQAHPKDILILIRKRGELLDELQAELMQRKIPFSSPNRLRIWEDELVKFIIDTITITYQPNDAETLFRLLRNPLLNIQDQAIELALNRLGKEKALWELAKDLPIVQGLLTLVQANVTLEAHYLTLFIWAKQHLPISSHSEANALKLLDFLRTWVWGNNQSFLPSEFVHRIQALDILQEDRQDTDALRILTVHGAKGLQAPIVFLVDTTQLPTTRTPWVQDELADILLCIPKREDESEPYQQLKETLKQKELSEYYRLLYVALTRAENELHIFGSSNGKLSPDSWYALCQSDMGT